MKYLAPSRSGTYHIAAANRRMWPTASAPSVLAPDQRSVDFTRWLSGPSEPPGQQRAPGPVHHMAVTWSSPPYATFEAFAPDVEARWGRPLERDLDSNGLGLYDCHLQQFSCGLQIALWRFHLGRDLQPVNMAHEPSIYEIHANRRELEHAVFHLGVPIESVHRWTTRDGTPLAEPVKASFVVMRQDDNGNQLEVMRVTSRCEAEALVLRYEGRGHKQTYWIDFVG